MGLICACHLKTCYESHRSVHTALPAAPPVTYAHMLLEPLEASRQSNEYIMVH